MPKGIDWYAAPFAIEARCVECRWSSVGSDPRVAACEHTLRSGHDTTVSMIGHVLFSRTAPAEAPASS